MKNKKSLKLVTSHSSGYTKQIKFRYQFSQIRFSYIYIERKESKSILKYYEICIYINIVNIYIYTTQITFIYSHISIYLSIYPIYLSIYTLIYIYIYIYISGILVTFLVETTFYLDNCQLNYTPFWCIWGICPNLRKLLKQVSQLIDLIDKQKLKFEH